MSKPVFKGTATAIVTPFTSTGLDLPALKALVDWQIESGVSALVACGTTGEPSTMTDAEWESVVSTVIEAADGRVPIIAGTGGNNTRHVIQLARRAKKLGAMAQLCVTPYYNKTTPQGLVAHYTAIAEDGSLPIILYNVPGRTGLNMQPETVAELSSHPQIVGMKEASADMIRLADMMRLCEGRIAFYSGSDEVIMPLMALGGLGVISVLSNVAPKATVALTNAMLAEDFKQAAKLQLQLMPLIHALFLEVNPIPAKAGLAMMGKLEDILRLPLVSMSDKNRAILRNEMSKLGLIS
ncbi:MAG: 4-hydroxy-tetrahydrodipicolinate synthase [Clostridiales bacterium]|nr:4-hydroxy-tetrahydrodipicolinate synthase [Clostridiales bacterium]